MTLKALEADVTGPRPWGTALLLATLTLAGCGSAGGGNAPGFGPDTPPVWASQVTNPYFPLVPGSKWEYRGAEHVRVEVLDSTRTIQGVQAVIVHDQVLEDGAVVEDTYDWYAQDVDGNVWYLGEDSRELKDGRVVSTAGSWEWGKNDARPGIIMWGDPKAHVGEEYRQERAEGVAEDWAEVVTVVDSVVVPAGTYKDCIRTSDWDGLEGRPQSLEHKHYCTDVGLVSEAPQSDPAARTELSDVSIPEIGRNVLGGR